MTLIEKLEALLPYIKNSGLDGKGDKHVRDAIAMIRKLEKDLATERKTP